MATSNNIVLSIPKIKNKNQCTWLLPKIFHENEGMVLLGKLQAQIFSTPLKSITIDFSNVEWADPQPLLMLFLLLTESNLEKKNIIINLGNQFKNTNNLEHRVFLKFFAEQGFIATIANYATLCIEDKIISTEEEIVNTKIKLSNECIETHVLGSDCIYARIIPAHEFRENEAKLKDHVEKMILEAHKLTRSSAFGGNPLARDMLLQKLRKLLFELLANIAEHSHPESNNSFAGVYARIRSSKPTNGAQIDHWEYLHEKNKLIHGQSDFTPNPYADWLELYVCDIGDGLLAKIYDWHEPNDPEAAKALQKAKESANPLESICTFIFRSPLSRNSRHDSERTVVTGLQHLGLILRTNGDYCRLYTQSGTWIGGHLPWSEKYSRKDLRLGHRESKMNKRYANLSPVSGTAYCFSIQPYHQNFLTNSNSLPTVNEKTIDSILKALREKKHYDSKHSITWFDRRNDNTCQAPTEFDLKHSGAETIILRPPRLMSKADFAKWLTQLTGNRETPPLYPVKVFILADLSPFQLMIFRELLRYVESGFDSDINIYLVTERWEVCKFFTNKFSSQFYEYPPIDFTCQSIPPTDEFNIADLAVVLRQMDSELFWSLNEDGNFDPFFNEKVAWPVGWEKEARIYLDHYLDFPQALAEPNRYRACRRALRRCSALFPHYACRAADDLVSSLVKELRSNLSPTATRQSLLIVGSVAVTAGTVHGLEREYGGQVIHIMVHGEADTSLHESHPLAALLWISDLPESDPIKSVMTPSATGGKPWKRIPRTPYIAPLGEQAISLMRYKRRFDGTLDFAASWYARTPEQTYQDFSRLGILKTGHWAYGSKHDLLTINVGLALLHAFIERGPLYIWLRDQFRELFCPTSPNKPSKAQLLIYPSHPVTDALFNSLRQDDGFLDRLPPAGIIPMKFLGRSTVSPLLASPLVAARIRDRVEGFENWAAVIVDDGVVSGKHMREQTQFVQSLGANPVYSLAILDRSGLPAQENVLTKYFGRHQRFWRWDVPPLGNKRECPLCKALLIAQTYAERLISERQKSRLGQWEKLWTERDVEDDWYSSGLSPVSFSRPVSVTFGVDAHTDGSRNEKTVALDSSTTAAAIILELTRLTTRSDVAMKKAELVKGESIDAAIEIIASQLLLFFDELSIAERRSRYKELISLIWTTSKLTTATSLVGICFTLLDREAIDEVWNYCIKEMLPLHRLGNLDAILATNILLFRYAYQTGQKYRSTLTATETERFNFVMLGGDGNLRDHIRDFLTIYTNPNIGDRPSCHTSDLYTQFTDLKRALGAQPTTKSQLNLPLTRLRQDCRFTEQVCKELLETRVISDQKVLLIKLQELLGALDDLTNTDDLDLIKIESVTQHLMDLLFGKNDGLLGNLADQLFLNCKNDSELDSKLIGPLTRDLRNRWDAFVVGKATDTTYPNTTKQRWLDSQGDVRKPEFLPSMTKTVTDVWFYCDSLVKGLVKDSLSNVYHSNGLIPDPWKDRPRDEDDNRTPKANLWWRATKDNEYLVIELRNGTDNREIDYIKQTMNLAGLDRVGGRLEVFIDLDTENGPIACTFLRLPLCTSFQKEKVS